MVTYANRPFGVIPMPDGCSARLTVAVIDAFLNLQR